MYAKDGEEKEKEIEKMKKKLSEMTREREI